MASFSKKLPLKYQELDYSGVIGNYNWIKEIISSLFENIEKPVCQISFRMGDISCSCESIDEFSEYAYGQTLNMYSYNLLFYQNSSDSNQIFITNITIDTFEKKLTIDCDNKKNLIAICMGLESSSKSELSDTLVQAETIQYIHDESTNVTIGDGNRIQDVNIGKNNTMHTNSPAQKEPFWKSVLQTLTANWLWFVLGLILVAVLGYLGFNNRELMNFF